ncbi:unnamed protein product [Taenia asiatica]|uniref:polynucleotide adenylyltransferase n=1 Tax=Taenia asiatica TaxID=60517 RepID=A0A158R9J2_TAEAS|nr:unnamed protein product [Taenia asiatica]
MLQVDLIMSRFSLSHVPSPIIFDQAPELFYLDVDHYSVHGLSGLHLSQKIRDLVPNFPLFTDLLKVIKIWASRRLISDYVYGFPASVAWAVLCAYICIHTTRFSNENYPYNGLLNPSLSVELSEANHEPVDGPLLLRDLMDIQNGHEIMPIITPIFPHKNAAYTVRPSSRDIVVKELQRGFHLTKKIVDGSATWEDLFEPYDIRQDYRHFLKLVLSADNFQELGRLGGLIDSRLRDLAGFLEEHKYIESVRIIKASDLPKHPCFESGSGKLSNLSECGRERAFKRAWLLGMRILKAAPLSDGSYPERKVDVTQYLQRFYGTLQERDPNTNFLDKLITAYVTRSDLHADG